MVDSLEAFAVPLLPTPPPLAPSQTDANVKPEVVDNIAVHSMESIRQVVSMVGDVVASGDVAPISGALFAKKALRLSRQLGG
jgi:nitrate reductase beta subunit